MVDDDSDLEESWRRDQDAAGRAGHEAWREAMIAEGWADHAFEPSFRGWDCVHAQGWMVQCGLSQGRHPVDMVPWEDLSPDKRQKYIAPARAAYALGFRAALGALDAERKEVT